MKKLLIAMAAGAALLPAMASAQIVAHSGPGMSTSSRTFVHGGFHPGMFPHRLHPGFVVPPMWFGPQFHVTNWQMYGFPAPPPRHRWVRYHDDAYLIDHGGRIRDARHGLDWDRYGERWDMENGIPHYYGRGDFHPGPEDYAWVERHRGRFDDDFDYAEHGAGCGPGCGPPGYGPPGPPPGYGPVSDCDPAPCGGFANGGYPPPGPPPGYGPHGPPMGYPGCAPGPQPCGGFGYGGYGYGVIAYPIVIETTVVSGGCGCCCVEEIVEEEVVEVRQRPRYRPPPRRRPRPAPPPPGERG